MTSLPNHFYVSVSADNGGVLVTAMYKEYTATLRVDTDDTEDFLDDFGDAISECAKHVVGMINTEPAENGLAN
jgi:hypothetical protein